MPILIGLDFSLGMFSKLLSRQPLFAKLSRSIALRVFLCFVAIEIVVLLPSYARREDQLAQTFETQAQTTLQPWIGLTKVELTSHLRRKIMERAIADTDLLGLAIYNPSGEKLLTAGDQPNIGLREWQNREATSNYDSARRVIEMYLDAERLNADYVVLAKFDATSLNQELLGYVLRIMGLVLIIGTIVTLGTVLTLHPQVLKPIYQLRNDLLIVGDAIAHDYEKPEMRSQSIQEDELGEVIQVFHGFVEEIYTAISDRKKVEVELKALNHTLQTEIQHRRVIEENLQKLNDQLQSLANSDGLTHVANRRFFDESLDREWRRMARQRSPISLILFDVDCFKQFNDHYGHQMGDDCLIQIAKAGEMVAKRPGDFIARYGGEEFILILPDTDLEGAKVVAQNLRHTILSLKIPHEFSVVSPWVTVSMGISTQTPKPKTEPSGLVKQADDALYQAKETGRDRFCCASDAAIETEAEVI